MAKNKSTSIARRPAPAHQVLEPQYKLTKDTYFGEGVKLADSIATYWGVPGDSLIPINALGRANKVAVQELRKEHAGNPDGYAIALRELDNELQQIGDYAELGEDGEYSLSDEDRRELESHAEAANVQLEPLPGDPAALNESDPQTIADAGSAPHTKPQKAR